MQASTEVGALAKAVGLIQLGTSACMAVVAGFGWGVPYAIAAMYGGLCAALPMGYFAFQLARGSRSSPDEIAGASFRGEIGKFGMTIVLLWLGVMVFTAQFMALLATYAACLMAYWIHAATAGTVSKDKGQ